MAKLGFLCVGPMEYDISNYTGGLPKLTYYPHARTKVKYLTYITLFLSLLMIWFFNINVHTGF